MKSYKNFAIKNSHKNSIILIGNFDGLHLGHQKLFKIAKNFKKKIKLKIGVIPSGPLREGLNSIKRADCVFINGNKDTTFEEKIYKINKNIQIFYSKYKIKNIENLKNKEIIAFAGIGNPSNFFDLLKENNINIKKVYHFSDHHSYSKKDFDKIITKDYDYNRTKIVTTEKDYCRMSEEQKKNCDCVEVDLEIENKNEFINLIKNKI